MLLVAVVWNATALFIDWNDLEQRPDSWGLFFGSIVTTVFYGGVPMLIVMALAAIAGASTPMIARLCAFCASALAAGCSVGLLVGAARLVTGPPAEVAFAVATALVAPLLMAPAVFCIRLASSERHPG